MPLGKSSKTLNSPKSRICAHAMTIHRRTKNGRIGESSVFNCYCWRTYIPRRSWFTGGQIKERRTVNNRSATSNTPKGEKWRHIYTVTPTNAALGPCVYVRELRAQPSAQAGVSSSPARIRLGNHGLAGRRTRPLSDGE